ncbi:hypothetical protein [Micromonospora gifhornensis]|uniref:PD-(D/E)XK nuclease superfamily protein n=1 Tax=Micromonospora gifhornensis TaxID=84594 RepID=A0ABQ4IMC9_9ACTN|nr:hypothetical protein [Micromonospora gifhornensis]GIJ19073.1 hypothetical protein Vgi01_57570 [Micromonospora gifhornensis]
MATAQRPLGGQPRADWRATGVPTDGNLMEESVPSFIQLWDAVQAAMDDLYTHDLNLLGTTERAIVGRLMVYLDRHLAHLSRDGLVLDQDYERAGQVTKTLVGTGMRARKVVPDLVFHRRRDPGPAGNLLAIEVKTDSRSNGRLHDFAKLSVLTGHVTQAIAYDRCLRLYGDPAPPRQSEKGMVGLPDGMHPYRDGLWLLLEPTGVRCWWWSNGRGPQLLSTR